MELRQLKYLSEIVKSGGFTKASESLGIAQSALSIAVKKLEEEAGVTLIDRNQRKLALTSEGAVFLKRANAILDQIGTLHQEMADLKDLVRGELKIGIPGMLATHYFPPRIAAFRELYPSLKISVYSEGAKKLESMLCNGLLDAAIIAHGNLPKELVWKPLLTDEMVVCVAPDHHLANRKQISIRELAKEPLFLFQEGNYQRAIIAKAFEDIGCKPKVSFETNLTSLLKTMTAKGGGACTLLRMAVDSSDLVAIPLKPTLEVSAGIAWREKSYLPLATKAFIDFLLEGTESPLVK